MSKYTKAVAAASDADKPYVSKLLKTSPYKGSSHTNFAHLDDPSKSMSIDSSVSAGYSSQVIAFAGQLKYQHEHENSVPKLSDEFYLTYAQNFLNTKYNSKYESVCGGIDNVPDPAYAQYSYEEIISMANNGVNIPKNVLAWAKAQQEADITDYIIVPENSDDFSNTSYEESNINMIRSEVKDYAVKSRKAQEDIEISKEKNNVLINNASDISKQQSEKYKNNSIDKTEEMVKEWKILSNKIKETGTLSQSENAKFKELSKKLQKNSQIIQELKKESAELDDFLVSIENLNNKTQKGISTANKAKTAASNLLNTNDKFNPLMRVHAYKTAFINSSMIADALLNIDDAQLAVVTEKIAQDLENLSNETSAEIKNENTQQIVEFADEYIEKAKNIGQTLDIDVINEQDKNDNVEDEENISEETTVAPEEETTVAPVEETTVAPEEESTVALAEEMTVAPEEEATVAPVEETTVAPKEEATVAPVEETTVAPEEEATVAPVEETTVAPEEEATVALEEEIAIAPEKKLNIEQEEYIPESVQPVANEDNSDLYKAEDTEQLQNTEVTEVSESRTDISNEDLQNVNFISPEINNEQTVSGITDYSEKSEINNNEPEENFEVKLNSENSVEDDNFVVNQTYDESQNTNNMNENDTVVSPEDTEVIEENGTSYTTQNNQEMQELSINFDNDETENIPIEDELNQGIVNNSEPQEGDFNTKPAEEYKTENLVPSGYDNGVFVNEEGFDVSPSYVRKTSEIVTGFSDTSLNSDLDINNPNDVKVADEYAAAYTKAVNEADEEAKAAAAAYTDAYSKSDTTDKSNVKLERFNKIGSIDSKKRTQKVNAVFASDNGQKRK